MSAPTTTTAVVPYVVQLRALSRSVVAANHASRDDALIGMAARMVCDELIARASEFIIEHRGTRALYHTPTFWVDRDAHILATALTGDADRDRRIVRDAVRNALVGGASRFPRPSLHERVIDAAVGMMGGEGVACSANISETAGVCSISVSW